MADINPIFQICIDCFSDNNIKHIITKVNQQIDTCDFCKNSNTLGLEDSSIYEIKNYIDSFIVFKYDEEEYADKFGGQYLHDLCEKNGDFFHWKLIKDKPKEADLLDTVFDTWNSEIIILNPDYPTNIAVNNEKHSKGLKRLEQAEEYLEKVEEITALIKNVEEHFIKDVPRKKFYRARIGHVNQRDRLNRLIPYKDNEIGSPPPKLASSGRANRQYLSFLYLAEDIETAINEVRALPGDWVSVGEFEPLKSLRMFNLDSPDILNHSNSLDAINELRELCSINNLFARPVGNSSKVVYINSQLISEYLIKQEYDGLAFKSSFTGNSNFTIFSPSNFKFKSSGLYKIEGIKLEYRKPHFFE